MFPTKILARIYGLPSQKHPEAIGYDEVFKGEASAPSGTGVVSDWMPGLRPVEYDVDSYFKDPFCDQI